MDGRILRWLVPTAFALVGGLVLLALARGGWPGTTGVSALVFCEQVRDGVVGQPANAWSNLAFVLVGLWAGLDSSRRGRSTPFLEHSRYPTLAATNLVGLGLGSFAMHASTTAWGGRVDVLSMFTWGTFVLAGSISRLWPVTPTYFAALYALLLSGSVWVVLASPWSERAFEVLVVVVIVVETIAGLRSPSSPRRAGWLAAAAFALAFAVWLPSRTDGPLCAPESWLQGHAVWHVLCALGAAALYVHHRDTVRPWSPS